jgi:transcriptional antiterminator RfaH
MENWYLACHKSGRHNAFKAQMFLENIGTTVFIPQVCCLLPRSDRPGNFRKVLEPLFPGYLFIYFDYEIHHSSKVASTPGISHFVSFGGVIKPLHDSTVDDIMRWTLIIDNQRYVDKNSTPNHAEYDNIYEQYPVIRRIMEEPSGETRSALFYTFIESNNGNKVG